MAGHANHCSTVGQKFVERFYQAMDKDRAQLANLYDGSATVIWNGNPIDMTQMAAFLGQMPPSLHLRDVIDAQPTDALGTPAILVAVTGKVEHGSRAAQPFSQSFLLLSEEPDNVLAWRIANDCFRLL